MNVMNRTIIEQNTILEFENEAAEAKISLFGGHVISYVPKHDSRERLWMSSTSKMNGTESIRGGIPICWPWFATQYPNNDSSLPRHGFVRSDYWELAEVSEKPDCTLVTLKFPKSRGAGLNGTFELSLVVSIGNQLEVSLEVINTGESDFSIGGALHSYFSVDDISQTKVEGLSGNYIDKMRDSARFPATSPTTFHEETDRIYQTCEPETQINFGTKTTQVTNHGHDSIVVWNPWLEGAQSIGNMPDDGYKSFVCVEAAITGSVTVAAGEKYVLRQIIS